MGAGRPEGRPAFYLCDLCDGSIVPFDRGNAALRAGDRVCALMTL
jgi:hypothetical protein